MAEPAKRIRSPNYPAISLAHAVGQLKALFERIHKHAAPKEAVAKALGYGGFNGQSAMIISAHTKYGLLERTGEDQYKISKRAMQIMFPNDPAEKATALREAALAPSLYAELVEDFGDIPPHDDILHPWLMRRGFAPTAVSAVIQGYRDTMALVQPTTEEYDSERFDEQDHAMETQVIEHTAPLRGQSKTALTPNPGVTSARPVKSSFEVRGMIDRLDVTGVLLDQQATDKLIAFLQMAKTTLPLISEKDDATSPTALPPPS